MSHSSADPKLSRSLEILTNVRPSPVVESSLSSADKIDNVMTEQIKFYC